LVLDAGEVDELELDDPDLARELEELEALRAAVTPKGLATSRAPEVAAASLPSARAATPGKPANTDPQERGSTVRSSKASLSATGGKSLADTISGGADDVDAEFQKMEQELQQQLAKYKEQCQAEPVTVAPVAPADASTASRPSSKASARGKEQASASSVGAGEPDDQAEQAMTPELLNLRAEAAKLEEVFPDAAEDASKAAAPVTRNRRVRRGGYNAVREEVPDDPEMLELKQTLSGLDLRMNAIKEMHALHDRDSNTTTTVPPAAARAIAELQAQNSHLRERFKTMNKRGVLQLNASLFGAAEKAPKVVTPAPLAPQALLEERSVEYEEATLQPSLA
jgi:hypothetical protein